jgi:hypothetical protein
VQGDVEGAIQMQLLHVQTFQYQQQITTPRVELQNGQNHKPMLPSSLINMEQNSSYCVPCEGTKFRHFLFNLEKETSSVPPSILVLKFQNWMRYAKITLIPEI